MFCVGFWENKQVRNEPLKDLNDLIPVLGIRARLGMSPKELRLIYEKKQKDFEKEIDSARFRNVLRRRKREKEEMWAPLWEVSDEKFWDDSCPDPRCYILATSQLKVLGEETNMAFHFADDKLCAIVISRWKPIAQPEAFTEESKRLISFFAEKYRSPYVKEDRAENLAWDERKIYKWEDIRANSLELKVYFKEQRADGFEVVLLGKEFKNFLAQREELL